MEETTELFKRLGDVFVDFYDSHQKDSIEKLIISSSKPTIVEITCLGKIIKKRAAEERGLGRHGNKILLIKLHEIERLICKTKEQCQLALPM